MNFNKYAGLIYFINTSMINELIWKQNLLFKKSSDKYYEELNKLIDKKIKMVFDKAYNLEKHVIDVIRDYTYSIDDRIESKNIIFFF